MRLQQTADRAASVRMHSHDEEVSHGLSIVVSRLTEDQAASLTAWDGEVTDNGPDLVPGWQVNANREILPHAEAYLHESTGTQDEFNENLDP